MRILLVSHGPTDSNSAQHVLGFARGLAVRGHEVRVAVVESLPEGVIETKDGYAIGCLQTMVKKGGRFTGGKTADVLHVWTPREPMRWFAEEYLATSRPGALAIHLEDNEEVLFQRFAGKSVAAALHQTQDWPAGLIHPAHYRAFLASAQGITLVHRCVGDLFPEWETHELPPIMDFSFFSPGDPDHHLREKLGLGPKTKVIVYNGNDHPAAMPDIHLLYEAVDLLIRRGRDVALVRTGQLLTESYAGLRFRPGPRCCELGFVARERIPAIVRLASVCVQPGNRDEFNSYRLPSKLPEYLASGKPVITGEGNIGPELAAQRCAMVLPSMTPASLADAVENMLDHPSQAAHFGQRARMFAQQRFAAATIIPKLESFYENCLKKGKELRQAAKLLTAKTSP